MCVSKPNLSEYTYIIITYLYSVSPYLYDYDTSDTYVWTPDQDIIKSLIDNKNLLIER